MSISPDCTFTSERSKQRLARVLQALEAGSLTREEIAKCCFMSNTAANLYLTRLKTEPKRVYRSGWEGNKPKYSIGNKKDVPFPNLMRKQTYKRFMVNKPELHEKKLERQRMKYWEARDATKLVGIDRRSPPLATQIENYVIVNRHRTTGQVAKALDAKPNSVSTILKRLAKEGKVRPVTLGDTRFKWESALHPARPAVTCAKQNIFSALGL